MTTKKNGKNKGGRPKIVIDWLQFNKLCILQCTLSEIAAWFNCSEDTIENKVKQEHKVGFSDYYKAKKGIGKIALRRKLDHMADKNPAVAIFLAKNHLGMSDRQDIEVTTREVTAMSDKELEALVEK